MKRSCSVYVLSAITAASLCALSFLVYQWVHQDERRDAAALAAIEPAIKKAIELGRIDPWAATRALTQEVEASVASLDACRKYACERTPAVVRFEETRQKLFHEALDRKAPAALVKAFASGEFQFPLAIAIVGPKPASSSQVAVWVESLLSAADSASGSDETSRAMLRTAGEVLESGRSTLRNTARATNFYARAWAAGDPKAAGKAARVYHRLGDLENAYLWSVRCINHCDVQAGPGGFNSAALQARIPPGVIAQAERLAADPAFLGFHRADASDTTKPETTS